MSESSLTTPTVAGLIRWLLRSLRRAARACAAAVALATTAAAWAGSVTYAHDALGRLRTVTYGNGVVITYTYDASGNRITVVTAGSPA
jgi:YD repeat-containing protein